MITRTLPARSLRLVTLVCGVFALLFLAGISSPSPLAAQADDARQEAVVEVPELSLWDRSVAYVRQQREIQRGLADAIKNLRKERSLAAAWSLIALSFFYGVFHALGPGHGKAVISTYLLTQRSDLKKGLALSWGGSLLQGVTAIAIVYGAVALIDWSQRDARHAVGTLESVSFALIALIGVVILLRSLTSLARAWRKPAGSTAAEVEGSHCGHNHGPSAAQLHAASDLRGALSVMVSIGIRPCSGAVLVLLIAQVLALHLAGLAAVLAMSVGTALTVSVMAVMAVFIQQFSKRLAGFDGHRALVAGHLAAMAGGLLIALMGALLFAGSQGPSHPLL